ncbi:DNA polymerase subunit gamma-2, mitochondrial [Larimichthys crocea]|uniref:Uncharacterized protein n=1 Tax=Larimichthys crocea TaxID=215358 RepID=A0ACD3RWB8_LARCR|nr:DNA polymerase subunit gamma-2, mitochondrial [Larimichthys crocea]
MRTNFLQGALEEFVPSLELVNRKLPFGLAETGLCFQPSDGSGCPAEVTQTSLVWFCSPRTSSQWLDHWTRQRLKWWRKFALSPSDFSSSDVPKEELEETVSRGVRITYNFPWGQEPLEELWSRGNTELLADTQRSSFQTTVSRWSQVSSLCCLCYREHGPWCDGLSVQLTPAGQERTRQAEAAAEKGSEVASSVGASQSGFRHWQGSHHGAETGV